MAFLDVTSLTKRFGPSVAVESLDLRIDAGEIYALLGPNGAGKTTTLRMIAGITPPTFGEIRVGGADLLTEPTVAKSRFFFIPDRPYLYQKLTGREYLEFLVNIYDRGNLDTIVELMEDFEMSDRLDHLIESYSHGMRQKLLLGAAFLINPPLLLIDEPLVGLDPRSARVLRTKIVDFARGDHMALISTHQLALAEMIATRIGILDRGRLILEGGPREIQERHSAGTLEQAFLELTAKEGAV
ncbi:ABC transporter ATP-binding protein [bacterium]|nr:ABC transporter ATP-binding protein [bacterium]